MSILSFNLNAVGNEGNTAKILELFTNDAYSVFRQAGYLNNFLNKNGISLSSKDMVIGTTFASDTNQYETDMYNISISNGVYTLVRTPLTADIVTPTTVNHLAIYTDTVGTISEDTAEAYTGGNIQATSIFNGDTTTPGSFVLYPPTTTSGTMQFYCFPNLDNYDITITNDSHGQSSIYSLQDYGMTGGTMQCAPIASSDKNIVPVVAVVPVAYTDLATAGTKIILPSTGSQSFIPLNMFITVGTNFSGGDRDIIITDGTTTYSTITAATIGTLSNLSIGAVAGFDYSASVDFSTATDPGSAIIVQYSGGATDYTAGATNIIIYAIQIA